SCASLHHSHARLRVHWAPGIPHALFGRKVHAQPGRSRRGNAELCLMNTIAPRSRSSSPGLTGRPSIPETLMIKSRGRGVLDRPVKPDDDRFGCLKIESELSM